MSIESVILWTISSSVAPSLPALSFSQHQGLFQWVGSLHRWPKYWSFSFNLSPFSEYLGLTSFRIDWFDLLAVQGTLKTLLQHHNSKASKLTSSLSNNDKIRKRRRKNKEEMCITEQKPSFPLVVRLSNPRSRVTNPLCLLVSRRGVQGGQLSSLITFPERSSPSLGTKDSKPAEFRVVGRRSKKKKNPEWDIRGDENYSHSILWFLDPCIPAMEKQPPKWVPGSVRYSIL